MPATTSSVVAGERHERGPLLVEGGRVVGVEPDRGPHVRVARRPARPPARDVSRSVPTQTRPRPRPPGRRRRGRRVLGRLGCRCPRSPGGSGCRPSRRRPGHGGGSAGAVDARGRAGAPFSSAAPAGQPTPGRRLGEALLLGGAGAGRAGARARAAARGISGDGEQRDDAQRLEAVAEHRRDRGGVAGLVERPRLAFLDVRVGVADEVPHRAEPAREVELLDAGR